jgi:alpha-D-xyloside xylohydrolase
LVNFWTNEQVHGGKQLMVEAPIDTIPLFVRAGSILPMGSPIESTNEKQTIEKVRIYPGADAHFTLYSDDGRTYDYEQGERDITELFWDNASCSFTHTGANAWSEDDAQIADVIRDSHPAISKDICSAR